MVLDNIKIRPITYSYPSILTIDAEKAFDNVTWDWLNLILDHLKIEGPFGTYLSSLYSNPVARVYTSGFLSPAFKLQKGTRRWPLSPLLFNLALETLFRYLATLPDIRGIVIGGNELKLALFADDIIFFLAHPLHVIPVLEHLSSFGLCSGFRVNASKSELLVLSKGADYSPVQF